MKPPQNSLVIFTFKVVEGDIYWLHSKPISETLQYDLLTNTELRVVFPRWPSLASKRGHHKQRVAPSSPIFEISATYHTNLPINRSIPPHFSLISLLEYAVEKEHTGFRRVTGYGIIVSRGAASAMMFSFSTLLVTMSRNIITFLRETLIMNWIPFDSAIAFHKYVAVWALFFTGRVIRIGKIT